MEVLLPWEKIDDKGGRTLTVPTSGRIVEVNDKGVVFIPDTPHAPSERPLVMISEDIKNGSITAETLAGIDRLATPEQVEATFAKRRGR